MIGIKDGKSEADTRQEIMKSVDGGTWPDRALKDSGGKEK